MESMHHLPRPAWRDDLKIAVVWGMLAGLAAAAVIPYMMQLMPEKFAALPMSLPTVIVLQAVQACLLIGLMSYLGLRMGHRVGLGSPVMRSLLARQGSIDWRPLRPLQAIAFGIVAALMVLAASAVLDPMLPTPVNAPASVDPASAAWSGLLASLYGGIAEELQLRLFLMTLLVWLFARMGKASMTAGMYWLAIVIAALLFGAGHLPAADAVWGLDGFVAFRTVALNAIAGVVFGWIYWKRGLEMAMLSHFSADIVLHVLAPLSKGMTGA